MKSLIFLVLFITTFSCQQKSTSKSIDNKLVIPVKLYNLPNECDESSGLEYVNKRLYTMNDSGGKDVVYEINTSGKISDEIKLKDAKNKDWEDIAYGNAHFYVGDFGNNLGNRKDLTIYELQETKGEKADTKAIKFRYGNQTDYSTQNRNHSFDCEAMIVMNNQLVLFSKDWATYQTQVYKLPTNAKDKLVLFPIENLAINALITGADYNEATKTLVLCGYKDYNNYVWVFNNSTIENVLPSNYKKVELEGLKNAQVEGITFKDESTIIVSTEKTKSFQQQVWSINLKEF